VHRRPTFRLLTQGEQCAFPLQNWTLQQPSRFPSWPSCHHGQSRVDGLRLHKFRNIISYAAFVSRMNDKEITRVFALALGSLFAAGLLLNALIS
jgi:hypothetical protein